MRRKLSASLLIAGLLTLGFAAKAGAVDGTIEINQAKVLAAGGFPYAITTSGTYRLTGNLTLATTNTDAIEVGLSNVTIDLNGFAIIGGGSSGTAAGINALFESNVAVKNGTITGFQFGAIVGGANNIVSGVHADSNAYGIVVGDYSVVDGCTVTNSTFYGIACGNGCVISGNTAVNDNYGIYISASGGLIIKNTAVGNSTDGIFASDGTTGWGQNVMGGNGTNHAGGTSLGQNLCSGAAC